MSTAALSSRGSDGVGGPLGDNKAYRKLALKHHPDKMKRGMKVVLKVFIFWKLAFQFPGSPEHPTGVLKAVFSRKNGPWTFESPERPRVVLKPVFFLRKNCLVIFWRA